MLPRGGKKRGHRFERGENGVQSHPSSSPLTKGGNRGGLPGSAWIEGHSSFLQLTIALVVLCASTLTYAQPAAPKDQQIERAIVRGVQFLKGCQSSEGHWDEPAQNRHRLGVTALAGLALLENGVGVDDSAIARRVRLSRLWHGDRTRPTTSPWRSCSWRVCNRAGGAGRTP